MTQDLTSGFLEEEDIERLQRQYNLLELGIMLSEQLDDQVQFDLGMIYQFSILELSPEVSMVYEKIMTRVRKLFEIDESDILNMGRDVYLNAKEETDDASSMTGPNDEFESEFSYGPDKVYADINNTDQSIINDDQRYRRNEETEQRKRSLVSTLFDGRSEDEGLEDVIAVNEDRAVEKELTGRKDDKSASASEIIEETTPIYEAGDVFENTQGLVAEKEVLAIEDDQAEFKEEEMSKESGEEEREEETVMVKDDKMAWGVSGFTCKVIWVGWIPLGVVPWLC